MSKLASLLLTTFLVGCEGEQLPQFQQEAITVDLGFRLPDLAYDEADCVHVLQCLVYDTTGPRTCYQQIPPKAGASVRDTLACATANCKTECLRDQHTNFVVAPSTCWECINGELQSKGCQMPCR